MKKTLHPSQQTIVKVWEGGKSDGAAQGSMSAR